MAKIDGKYLRAAAMFAAQNDVRAWLGRVYVYGEPDGRAIVTASDGHTLFWSEVDGAVIDAGEAFAVPAKLAAKAAKGLTDVALDRVGATLADCAPEEGRDVRDSFGSVCRGPWTPGWGGPLDARYVARVGDAFAKLNDGAKYGAPILPHCRAQDRETSPTVFATAERGIRALALVMPMRGAFAAELPAVVGG